MVQSDTPSVPDRIDLSPRDMSALIAVLLLSFAAALGMAFNIGAMISTLGASEGQAGLVASIELASVSIASLVTARFLSRYSIHQALVAGATLAIVGNALTILFQDIDMMLLWRAIGGLGGGTVIAGLNALAARARNPEMTFGLINGSIGIGITIVAVIVPMAIKQAGLGGAYTVYLVLAMLAFVAMPFVPKGSDSKETQTDQPNTQNDIGLMGWAPLFGLGAVFLGHNALFSFAAPIGGDINLSVDQVGFAIGIGGLLTIVGPIAAGVIGNRFGSLMPVFLILALTITTAYFFAAAGSQLIFLVVVPVFMMLPLTMLPFFLGGLSNLDSTGRLVAANPAFVTMGAAIGPAIGGIVADRSGFLELGVVAIGLILLGAALMFAGLSLADSKSQRSV